MTSSTDLIIFLYRYIMISVSLSVSRLSDSDIMWNIARQRAMHVDRGIVY